MKLETKVNGVQVDRLLEIMDHVKAQPDLANFEFRAKNRWKDGTHSRAEIQAFYGVGKEDASRQKPHVYDIDEPTVLLGNNRGANPAEFLLTALSGCVTTTFIAYASAMGVKIDELRTELDGDVDLRGFLGISDEVRPGFREIRVKFFVKSDAPREKILELMNLTERRSSLTDTLQHGVPVRFGLAS